MEKIINTLNQKYSNGQNIASFRHVLSVAKYEKIKKKLDNGTLDNKDKKEIIFESYISTVDPLTKRTETIKGKTIYLEDLEPAGLLDDYKKGLSDEIAKKMQARKENRVNNTQSNLFVDNIGNSNSNLITKSVSLAVPTADSKYTDADKAFFKWWARDDHNNFYMKLKSGQYIPVPLVEGQVRKIAPDPIFWTAFWKDHRDEINRYDAAINNIAWTHYEHNEDANINMLRDIHMQVPKLILENTCLTATIESVKFHDAEKNEDVTVKTVRNIEWTVGSPSAPKTTSEYNFQQALAPVILQLDTSEIEEMKRMTNDFGAAMFKYVLPEENNKPTLPPTWKDFLKSAFTVNPYAQKYRLAKFISSVIDANNYASQALCIAGYGGDGKSVMLNAIMQGLNRVNPYTKFMKIVKAEGIRDDNTQNGLVDALESRVIYMPEVKVNKEIFESGVFKAITGLDEIQCQKKYAMPITKNMSGTKFVWTTNYNVYVSGQFAIRRTIPMFFSPKPEGFKLIAPQVLTKSLLDEFPEFVSWCWNFARLMDKKFNLPHDMTPIVDIDSMIAGTEPMSEKECWESLCIPDKGQRFFFKAADEYEEEEHAIYQEFVNECFMVFDPNTSIGESAEDYKVSTSDIYQAWVDWTTKGNNGWKYSTVVKIQPKSSDTKKFFTWLVSTYPTVEKKKMRIDGKLVNGVEGIKLPKE